MLSLTNDKKFNGENSPPMEGWRKFFKIFDGVVLKV
jgi:hypothetical protein